MHFSVYAAMNYNSAISLIDQALSEDVDAYVAIEFLPDVY